MNDKNARELLEESLSYISLPLALYGGVQITGWCAGAEIEPREYGDEWLTRQTDANGTEIVLNEHGTPKVEVIDPSLIKTAIDASGTTAVAVPGTVCAIGAIALASLDNALGVRQGMGEYTSWDIQCRSNPDVALASVALAYAVLNQRAKELGVAPEDYVLTGTQADLMHGRTLDEWVTEYAAVKDRAKDEPISIYNFGVKVEHVGSLITAYNDEQVSWVPVARVFESAIKSLIEKGF